ncbi:WD repeat-containing protein 62 isoform X3 [Xyrichtys novacula]|uniref:WD repeat-containing protein 62 isoform X3 n=1 Tax=Xyrichtys novacula TaxID=13765 RepID=A0AAV1FXG6_XYRNO|nr:WD repeat-containing protein 62 isoform X3 [Xyrichtys novacula]
MMAEGADCGSVGTAKRRQPAGRKSRQSQHRKSSSGRVRLEKVLGICTASSSGVTSDPNSGLIAYPAGCVIVLLHSKKNKQSHIINTCRKPFSALAFSHDGKHLVTGESGHMPCVRVWEVGGEQAAKVQSHKYGVSCVAFSTNSRYIVSVGYQHDMTVSVWDWRKGSVIASNKVSSRVFAVSFSQDNSYFVTAGNRHVKFWYLDASKEKRVNSTVPLVGRSGLLGDHKNSVFSGVACGRGLMASSTYCITSSGLLCLFNSSRQLEAWVNLKTSSASCLAVSEDFIFCGCANGVVRVFSPCSLQYISTLQRPHRLGVELLQSTQLRSCSPASPGAQYPDTLALTYDPTTKHLTCVYNDHSVYVWNVTDVRSAVKLYSALYHSGCVWNIQVYPELSELSLACLPPSSFFTCSSDNTIRLWHADAFTGPRNSYSNDLLRILYVGENTQHLQAEGEKGEATGADGKAGIRVLGISPDGQHLAAGDRCGNLHIFGLKFLDQLVKIEAHDSEVLCLEFSPTSTGVQLLASAGRDRLIHVFNLQKNYSLEQTLSDHSASITAVKFTGKSPEVRMVSCGADKSIYFQTAEQTVDNISFSRSHHVVEKTTLYDMDLDSSRTHVAIACQDRNVRVYNVETGKLKKCLKGSSSDEGALLKVEMDPSGSFFATSCSDKNISIFDYESGECVATLFGHSEIVTCMRFSQDCRHLITVSGDSCVFVWRLDSQMTNTMRKRRGFKLTTAPETCRVKQQHIRRETFITVPSSHMPHLEEEEADSSTPTRLDSAQDTQLLQTNGKLPMWFRKLGQDGASSAVHLDGEPSQARCRWTEQLNPLVICSNFSPSPTKSQEEEEQQEEEEDFHPQSLESLLGEEEEEEEGEEKEVLQDPGEDRSPFILHPNTTNTTADRDFNVEGMANPQHSLTQLEVKGQGTEPVWSTQLSPDSACSEGSAGSLEQLQDADTDSLSQGSSVGSLVLEDDEDRNLLKNHFDTLASSLTDEKFDTDLRTLQPPEEKHFLNPRLSISTRFLSRFQDRIRAWPSQAPSQVSIPSRISEESNISNTSVNAESSSEVTSNNLAQTENMNRLDVTSNTLAAQNSSTVQQGALHSGYLGTTASSRAKLSQDLLTTLNTSSHTCSNSHHEEGQEQKDVSSLSEPQPPPPPLQSVGLDLNSPEPEPCQDQTVSVAPSQRAQDHTPETSSQALVVPTDVMSEGGASRWSISSVEETLRSITRTTPTKSDIIQCDASRKEGQEGSENKIQNDSVTDRSSVYLPTSSSSPPSETLQLHPSAPAADEELSLLQCQQVASELRETTRRAVHLYRQLGGSEKYPQMLSVLRETFDAVHSELQTVLHCTDEQSCSAPFGLLESDGTLFLLEKYSELLVQMTQNKLNRA